MTTTAATGALYASRSSPWTVNDELDFTLELPSASVAANSQITIQISLAIAGSDERQVLCGSQDAPNPVTCRNRTLNVNNRQCASFQCRNAVLAQDLLGPVPGRYDLTARWCPLGSTQCRTVNGGPIQVREAPTPTTSSILSTSTTTTALAITLSLSDAITNSPSTGAPRTLQTSNPTTSLSPNPLVQTTVPTLINEGITNTVASSTSSSTSSSMSTETVALISAGSICAILLVVAGCIFYRQSIRRARHRRSEEVVHNLYSANGYNKPAHYGGTPGSRPTSAAKKEAFLVGLLAPLSPTSKKAFLADDMYTVRYPTKTSSRSDDQRKSTLTKYHDLPSFAEANQNAYPAMDGGSEVGSQVGAVPPFAYDPYTGQPTYGFDPNYQPGYTYSQGYVPDPQYAGASFTDSQLANYPGYYDQNGQYHWFQNEGIPMAQAQPYPAFPFDPNQVAMYPVENVTEPTPPPSALDTQTVAPPTPPPKS